MATEYEILAFLKRGREDSDLKEWVPFEASHLRTPASLRAAWVRRRPGQTPPALRLTDRQVGRLRAGLDRGDRGLVPHNPAGEREIA